MAMRSALDAYFTENRQEILDTIRELVAIPSTEDRPEEVARCLDWCLEKCRGWGMRTGKAAGGDSGWAEIGEGTETVGILAHVDVVKIGDRSKWKSDPFEMTERDGRIIGRGVIDDKGPLAVALYAMHAVTALRMKPTKKIRFIFGTSEETDWTDMANYRAQFGAPDCGFSPDGNFPIFNVERGYMDLTLRFRDGHLRSYASMQAGDSPNTVPGLCRIRKMGEAPKTWQGKSVHSSQPENGVNAIVLMGRDMAKRGLRIAKFIADYLDGDWCGARLGLPLEDTWNGIYVGKTTLCPTVLRLEGGEAVLNVNVRVRCGVTPEEIVAAFAAKGEEYGFTVTGKAENMPVMVDRELPFLQEMNRVYEKKTGRRGEFLVATGCTYAQCMPRCVAWGPVFPEEEMTAHRENECADVESLLTAGQIYAEFLRAYCCGK